VNVGSSGEKSSGNGNAAGDNGGISFNISSGSDRSPVKTEARKVDAFTAIKGRGKGEYNITAGKEQSVSVEANEKSLNKVITKVVDGSLIVSLENNTNPEHLKFQITSPHITDLDFAGAITANLDGVDEKKLNVSLSGATTFKASGTADEFDVHDSGAVTVVADQLKSKKCTVRAEGASTVDVNASESADVDVSGASTVHVSGKPKNVKQHASGACTINIE